MSAILRTTIRKLEKLGNTADEIRTKLEEEGIKGVNGSDKNCPIARYLNKHSRRYVFSVGTYAIRVYDKDSDILVCRVDQTDAGTRFVENFDDNLYEELIEK